MCEITPHQADQALHARTHAPAAGRALERERRGLEADDHHLEAQQAEVDLPRLTQLAEPPGPHRLEEGGGGVRLDVRGEAGAGLLEGGRGELVVHGGQGAVALDLRVGL